MPRDHLVTINLPPWVDEVVAWDTPCSTPETQMALAIALSRANVERGTGGPFGAAVFEQATGRLVAVGVNSVVRLSNCTLHAEMTAIQFANRRLGTFSLSAPGLPAHVLATSCDPCAMCMVAVLWSGVKALLCGATRDDASALRFEEGPVFPESWRYLEERGIAITRRVLRPEAQAAMVLYRERAGPIYNG